jgi:hypothetical protein
VQCETLQPGDEGADAVPLTGGGALQGDLSGFANDYDPTAEGCTGRSCEGNDGVYRINADPGWTIDLTYLQPTGDASIYLVTDYNDLYTCVGAADVAGTGGEEHLSYVVPVARPTYYLIVDGHGPGGGLFFLTYSIELPSTVDDVDVTASSLLRAPNPYRPGALITFRAVGGPMPTELSLHDTQGRVVCTLLRGMITPGPHVIQWDGQTTSGRPAPAGMYYLRGALGTERLSQKLLLLR